MMILRLAGLDDIPQMMALERLPEFRELVGCWPEELHKAAMTGTDARYFVAENDSGELLGFAILRGLVFGNHSVEIKRIVVRTPGRGLGRQILEELIRIAFEELNAHRLWLDVLEHNARARHLYESLGFVREGVLREAFYRDGKYNSLILMSLLDREYAECNRSRTSSA